MEYDFEHMSHFSLFKTKYTNLFWDIFQMNIVKIVEMLLAFLPTQNEMCKFI